MADLDDFFAKKDKKKSKKPKFVTPEELTKPKKLEVNIASTSTNSSSSSGGIGGDESKTKEVEQFVEEEWKEFEEEQRKDYTGLKIGQLTLNDEDDNSPTDGDDDDVDSDGNTNTETKRSGGGPWKKVIPAEEVTQIPMEMEKSSKYISPALRQSQSQMAGTRLKARNRAAPDITNADFFPTLGAARPEEQRKKKNEPAFEEVRHGGRVQRVQDQQVTAPVAVTNRFQSLDQDDS